MKIPKDFKVIAKFVTGSHLYGNATEHSDIDIRGVFIPSEKYFYGFLDRVEQLQDYSENDIELIEIRKFLLLALNSNPNIIEFLFIPLDQCLEYTKEWERIIEARKYFVSTKCRWTFSGYAHSQFKRIQRHRGWLLNPPKKKPEREDFGLPVDRSLLPKDQIGAFNRLLALYMGQVGKLHPLREQLEEMQETIDYISVAQQLDNMDYKAVKKLIPVSDNMLEVLDKEKAYGNSLREWTQYQEWKKNRNPERAILEAKYGYDSKHASHLSRLFSECKELLTTGKITFPRPDAKFITDIRNGVYTYEQIMEFVKNYDEQFKDLYLSSNLPREPNRVKVNELCIDITKNYLNS